MSNCLLTLGVMKAAVRSIHSLEVADLHLFEPDNGEVFGVFVSVIAGPSHGPGEESFDLVVCSPRWFEQQLDAGEVRTGRHHLFTRTFDWPNIEQYIRLRVEACEGATWAEVGGKLSRLGYWEFEDYTP